MVHPLRHQVEEIVKSYPVVIFMKGKPDAPRCGFSARACEVLKQAGARDLVGIDVLENDALWDALEDYTQWPTVPQIFIHGKFVGGCDIVSEMHMQGELKPLLTPEEGSERS